MKVMILTGANKGESQRAVEGLPIQLVSFYRNGEERIPVIIGDKQFPLGLPRADSLLEQKAYSRPGAR